MSVRPGEIVVSGASRAFAVRADPGRSLKELVFRRTRGGPPPVQALRDVSFRVEPGETVAVVGRNGAGKTSTLRVLAGIVPLDAGRCEVGGRVVAQLELGAGFGRAFSGRENVLLNAALHGLTRPEVEERMDDILAFAELGEFIDLPVATYSQGMFLRLGFAIAAHMDPDVLLVDEVLAVGDEAFQRRCEARIAEQIAGGATLVLVSHDASLVERTCARVLVLDHGRLVFDGPTAEGLAYYRSEASDGRLRIPAAADDAPDHHWTPPTGSPMPPASASPAGDAQRRRTRPLDDGLSGVDHQVGA